MIAIPAISMTAFDSQPKSRASPFAGTGAGSGSEDSSDIQLTQLSELPQAVPKRRRTEIDAMKDWARKYFTEDEIEDMRERYIAGRNPADVEAEILDLARRAVNNDFTKIPNEVTELLKSRLGADRTEYLRAHIDKRTHATQLGDAALDELYPNNGS